MVAFRIEILPDPGLAALSHRQSCVPVPNHPQHCLCNGLGLSWRDKETGYSIFDHLPDPRHIAGNDRNPVQQGLQKHRGQSVTITGSLNGAGHYEDISSIKKFGHPIVGDKSWKRDLGSEAQLPGEIL